VKTQLITNAPHRSKLDFRANVSFCDFIYINYFLSFSNNNFNNNETAIVSLLSRLHRIQSFFQAKNFFAILTKKREKLNQILYKGINHILFAGSWFLSLRNTIELRFNNLTEDSLSGQPKCRRLNFASDHRIRSENCRACSFPRYIFVWIEKSPSSHLLPLRTCSRSIDSGSVS